MNQLAHEWESLIGRVESGEHQPSHDQQIKPRWRADPFCWARERLGVKMWRWRMYSPMNYNRHTWDGSVEPLWSAAKAVGEGYNVAITSATGIGKTYLGAIILLWWLDCWEGSQVITLAPKKDQLTLHIWKEVGKLWGKFKKLHPAAALDTLRIRMRPRSASGGGDEDSESLGDAWGAVGFPCGVTADEAVSSKARGFHAKDMLFIVEETTGMHDSILQAIRFTCTAPHNLRVFFGNPDSDQDALAKAGQEDGVKVFRASALDHPNIVGKNPHLIPGAQSEKQLDGWKKDLGEDSMLYQSRARGIPPAQSSESLIRAEWVDRAMGYSEPRFLGSGGKKVPPDQWDMHRAALMKKGPAALGVDVANSENGDRAAWAFGRGACLLELQSKQCPDANEFGRHTIYPFISSDMVKPSRVGVDTVGVGVGCWNELKRLGAITSGLNGGEAFWEAMAGQEVFQNLRSQMWWQMRIDLQHGRISLPDNDRLKQDLLAPTYRTKNGKICVESKEDFKARLKRSPDEGDAAVYWNWIRQAQRAPSFSTPSRTVPL